MSKRPLEIDMIAGSQLRDSQGEMLSVEGADISALQTGHGRFNDNHQTGFFNSLGRVTEAKKIFGLDDCETDRQRYYWEKVKAPFIYVAGFLYDDEDHPNARAAAAILRNIHKRDCPLKIKASVEGGVISRGVKDSTLLARTKIHSIALTFTPANQATLVEPVALQKSEMTPEDEALIKSVIPLAKSDVPSFRYITRHLSAQKITANVAKMRDMTTQLGLKTKFSDVCSEDLVNAALAEKIANNVRTINQMAKALTAGYGGGSPMDATGGQVLQSESLNDNQKVKYIYCNHCGDEQIYMDHQVKCRKCGKSFPLEVLAKLMIKKR